MNNDGIRKYDELNVYEKEVIDAFRQIKLISDYNRFKLYKYKIEDLISDYENEIWSSELRLMGDFKTEFDMAIAMIESGEAEQAIIDDKNNL